MICGAQKKIMVISHVPCSSGTYISAYLGKVLGANSWNINETSAYVRDDLVSRKTFVPMSPAISLLRQGNIALSDWIEIYTSQIQMLIDMWNRHDESELLIIRDHCYSEYFLGEDANRKEPVIHRILQGLGQEHVAVFTLRDPVDSWLGLNASFPREAGRYSVDSYCQKYIAAIEAWRSAYGAGLNEIKVEDVARSPVRSLQDLAGMFGKKQARENPEIHQDDLGSGASGRNYASVTIPARRPCSYSTIRQFDRSESFHRLRAMLGYEKYETPGGIHRVAPMLHQIYQPLVKIDRIRKLVMSVSGSASHRVAFC